MPTAAKLFGAMAFALMAFFTAEIVKPHMPESTNFGYMSAVAALVGVVCGWMVMGPTAGKGYYQSVGAGMKTAVVTAAWALFIFAFEAMLRQTMRNVYDGPMEAVVDVARFFVDYGAYLFFPDVATVLLVGGGLAGMLTEWAAKRWK